ncbi:hypothetical protein B0H11DRAFT_2214872 [Mycena galericulata]|nr:hypothetical protein B0H11DRAFT_2214872 [Mycena galericulata]
MTKHHLCRYRDQRSWSTTRTTRTTTRSDAQDPDAADSLPRLAIHVRVAPARRRDTAIGKKWEVLLCAPTVAKNSTYIAPALQSLHPSTHPSQIHAIKRACPPALRRISPPRATPDPNATHDKQGPHTTWGPRGVGGASNALLLLRLSQHIAPRFGPSGTASTHTETHPHPTPRPLPHPSHSAPGSSTGMRLIAPAPTRPPSIHPSEGGVLTDDGTTDKPTGLARHRARVARIDEARVCRYHPAWRYAVATSQWPASTPASHPSTTSSADDLQTICRWV